MTDTRLPSGPSPLGDQSVHQCGESASAPATAPPRPRSRSRKSPAGPSSRDAHLFEPVTPSKAPSLPPPGWHNERASVYGVHAIKAKGKGTVFRAKILAPRIANLGDYPTAYHAAQAFDAARITFGLPPLNYPLSTPDAYIMAAVQNRLMGLPGMIPNEIAVPPCPTSETEETTSPASTT